MAANKIFTSNSSRGNIKTFSCPACGGSIDIRAIGVSITAVCQSCGALVDVANENLRLIQKAAVKIQKSLIPLGARGFLFGVEWEAIGYTVRTDGSGLYDWREYLLFNPYRGFRFLVEADGHWSFVTMQRKNINADSTASKIFFDGDNYRLFLRGSAKVKYVMGEFYWRVKLGEKASIADYIAPPYMLSMEKSGEDIVWSRGVYVSSREVAAAFKLASLPKPDGIAPNQPPLYGEKLKRISLHAAAFFMALWGLQTFFAANAANLKLYEQELHVSSLSKGQSLVSEVIDMPGHTTANIEIASQAPLNNNWVELDISLVDASTQRSYDVVQPIEFYSGQDSDGYWSEGSRAASAMVSAVPAGKYQLLVEANTGVYQPMDVHLRVTRDVPMWANFWIAALLLMAYPFYMIMRHWTFENRRWQKSEYASGIYNVRLE